MARIAAFLGQLAAAAAVGSEGAAAAADDVALQVCVICRSTGRARGHMGTSTPPKGRDSNGSMSTSARQTTRDT